MKKITLLLFLIAFNYSWSQGKGDIQLGFFAGIQLSNVSDIEENEEASSKIGFNGGIYGDFYFNDTWSIKAKIGYDQKGYGDAAVEEYFGGQDILSFSFHYITVPITLNWHFGNNKEWYINAGPYVGYLLGANLGSSQQRDLLNNIDIGAAYGLGYKFSISENSKLFIEINGQSGLTDIVKDNSGDAIKNNRNSLNIGIDF